MMWYPPLQPIEFVTVKQMYAYAKENNIKLLSDYNAEFWSEYLANYAHYDRLFNRLYLNSYYFMQDANADADEVQEDFTNAVYDLLLMNSKRYSELYRIHVVDDDVYSILDNYDVTETKEGEKTLSITDSFGLKSVTEDNNKTITDALGQRITTEQNTKGSQEDSVVEKVAPYDSETFSNINRTDSTEGQRQDSATITQQTVTDTHETEEDNSTSYSAHEDTHEHEGSDSYTLTKKGNIGTQTQTEVIQKHEKFWRGYNFYKIIFEDINRELLLFDHAYL